MATGHPFCLVTMNFERVHVAKQQNACSIFIDIIDKKDPIDIETNQDVALTDTKCTRNVQKINGFSKQTAAYCTCNGNHYARI